MKNRVTLTTTDWRAVVAAALTSRRADCGHNLSRRDNALVWIRKELVGSNYELHTLCVDCHDDNTDYEYQADWPTNRHPERMRIDHL